MVRFALICGAVCTITTGAQAHVEAPGLPTIDLEIGTVTYGQITDI